MAIGGQETISTRHAQAPRICDADDGAPPLAFGIQLDDWDADGDADGGDPAADEYRERGAEGGDAWGGVEFVCFFGGVVGACGDWGGGFVVRGWLFPFVYFSGSDTFLPKRCFEFDCGGLN